MTTGNPLLAFDARTIGDHYPGIGRYAFGLWAALGERVGVTIIDPSLRNTRFPITDPTLASFSVRSLWTQIDVPLKLRGADLYYSPYFLIPYALPCPAVVTLYDATPLKGPGLSAMGRLVFRVAHRLAGQVAKRVIVLSESAREEMTALGVPREKMHVCAPGLDPKFRPAPPEAIAKAKRKYDLPDEFWLCFGSTRWHKNTRAAIEAVRGRTLVFVGSLPHAILRREAPKHLWADPETLRAFDAQSDKSESSANSAGSAVKPFVEENDFPAVYSAARALIFPSLREGFGLPIIEAMACGTPVVCLPAPGVKEAAGDAAMMAAEITTEALADAVRRLDDADVWHAKREAGLEWAKRFTWQSTVEAIAAAME
jgi:alpha-1,3-rhamnosyl/mannosyltransferase